MELNYWGTIQQLKILNIRFNKFGWYGKSNYLDYILSYAQKDINIFWFRQDLRLSDNPGLYNSIKNGATLPIFIFDDENSKEHIMVLQVNGGFTIH